MTMDQQERENQAEVRLAEEVKASRDTRARVNTALDRLENELRRARQDVDRALDEAAPAAQVPKRKFPWFLTFYF